MHSLICEGCWSAHACYCYTRVLPPCGCQAYKSAELLFFSCIGMHWLGALLTLATWPSLRLESLMKSAFCEAFSH